MRSILYSALIALTLALSVIGASAQGSDLQDEQFYIGGTYRRANLEIATPTRSALRVDTVNDSWGVTGGYDHFLLGNKKTGKKGWLGVGIDFTATFHQNQPNGSVVAEVSSHGVVTLQNRNAKRLQPYVRGGLGFGRTNFGGLTFVDGRLRNGNRTLSVIGGGGIDVVMKGRSKLRLGVDYQNTGYTDQDGREHNARGIIALVF